MEPTNETIYIRAVKIAAKIMQADGLCRYESPMQCHRAHKDAKICENCIRAWLKAKAKEELKRETEETP